MSEHGNAHDERPYAVRVHDLRKRFRIYHRHETTLKAAVLRRRRGVYEEFLALDDVSFDIRAGEAVGVIGRNGSGKSTLLKLLARILEPDGGSIEAVGRVAALLEVGAGFHPEYSAIENIYLSGAIYGLPRSELDRRVDDIIAFAELERFADNPVKTYSSGMYARLGFAIAVNVEPDILLIDEVLAVGDASFQARCLDRMLEFRDAGKTLILITHDLGAIESFCDRAIWLDHGRLREDGLPHHVVRTYVSEVSASEEERALSEVMASARPDGPAAGDHVPIHPHHPMLLDHMSFVDADGVEREVFHTGESLRVRVHFRCSEPQPSPICELRIDRHDHVHVATASTRVSGVDVGIVPEGPGYFEWALDDITVTPGTYYFTPTIYERTGAHAYDLHTHWYRLRIHAGSYGERKGAVILPGEWSVHAALPDEEPAGT